MIFHLYLSPPLFFVSLSLSNSLYTHKNIEHHHHRSLYTNILLCLCLCLAETDSPFQFIVLARHYPCHILFNIRVFVQTGYFTTELSLLCGTWCMCYVYIIRTNSIRVAYMAHESSAAASYYQAA